MPRASKYWNICPEQKSKDKTRLTLDARDSDAVIELFVPEHVPLGVKDRISDALNPLAAGEHPAARLEQNTPQEPNTRWQFTITHSGDLRQADQLFTHIASALSDIAEELAPLAAKRPPSPATKKQHFTTVDNVPQNANSRMVWQKAWSRAKELAPEKPKKIDYSSATPPPESNHGWPQTLVEAWNLKDHVNKNPHRN